MTLSGFAMLLAARLGLGRLPGDVLIHRDNALVAIPLATSLILSIVLTVALNVAIRVWR